MLDVGGVLLDWNPRHVFRAVFGGRNAEMERFLAEVCSPAWHVRNDLGPNTEENCRELAARHPDLAHQIMTWARKAADMVAGPIPGAPELVADLVGHGVPVYLLTNMEPETFPRRLERFPFLRAASGWVVSGFEGVMKPDRRIFERLLDRYRLEPARTLFVDDNHGNVAAAAAVGLCARPFTSMAELRAHLVGAGVL